MPIPYVIYTLALTPEELSRAMAQAAFGEFTNILLLVVLHRGYAKAASVLQVSAFWFFFTATALTGNGVQGEAYLAGYHWSSQSPVFYWAGSVRLYSPSCRWGWGRTWCT